MKKRLLFIYFTFSFFSFSMVMGQEERRAETIQVDQSSLNLAVSGNSVRIQNAVFGSLVEVYNILGVKVTSVRIDAVDKTLVLNLPKGYYIFKIGNVVRKVVIK